jgi:hypothetical protein
MVSQAAPSKVGLAICETLENNFENNQALHSF